MKRSPVVSSQITSVGYDATTNTLEVEFKHGGSVYQYSNFTPDDFKALSEAKSIGSHFLRTIKPNPAKWPFKKVEAAVAAAK